MSKNMHDELDIPTVLRKKLPPNLEKIKNGHYTRTDYDYSIHLYLKENDIRVTEEGSEIIKFLRGKSVLVTGGTGFLGRLLVEKLLRSCTDIKIYILVRTKKGRDPQARINECLDNWVFRRLSDIYPDYRERVIGISGDLELQGLGLSDVSRTILKEQVNIIYHVAATVRFDEKLKKAVRINMRGTQQIIGLAKECQNLNVFVYVSTAYSNCHQKFIKEEFYPPILDPYKLMMVVEELPEEIVDNITPQLLGPLPNTYTLTKQLAEDIVRREAIGLPICVQRPSIVIASVKEPVRSWVDNIFGPAGLIQGTALGLVHIVLGNVKGVGDMVPADYVINSCIAASYETAMKKKYDEIKISNYVSSCENPVTWGDMAKCEEQGIKVGATRVVFDIFIRYTTCRYWYLILNFMFHTIPGYIADIIAVQLGKKPVLGAAYRKIDKFISVLAHFTMNEWKFDNANTRKTWESLNDVDKKNFPFDIKSVKWQDYFDTFLVAMREFMVREFLDNLEDGRRHMKRLRIIHYIIATPVIILSTYYLLKTVFFFIPVLLISSVIFYKIF